MLYPWSSWKNSAKKLATSAHEATSHPTIVCPPASFFGYRPCRQCQQGRECNTRVTDRSVYADVFSIVPLQSFHVHLPAYNRS